jgi:hypothetical protein
MAIRLRLCIATTVTCLVTVADVAAQPAAAAPTSDDPSRGWTVAAGHEVFALRDVSRNIRPVDASPIKWEGRGPAVVVRRAQGTRRASHLFDGAYARATNFTYKGPTRDVDGLSGDVASHFEGSYEYRRYFWTDLAADGLDLGVGGRALASHVAMRRQISTLLEQSRSLTGGGAAVVLAARLHRWPRIHLHASWANGAVVSRRTSEHSADALSRLTTSGGNWLTELIVGGDVRLSRDLRLELEWRSWYEGYSSDHFAYAGDRQALLMGVRYAR